MLIPLLVLGVSHFLLWNHVTFVSERCGVLERTPPPPEDLCLSAHHDIRLFVTFG